MNKRIKDLTNQKFGRLSVVKFDKTKNNYAYWWCLCDCQLELPEEERELVSIRGHHLSTGNTKSCGCLQKEKLQETINNNKKYIDYDISDEYGIGYTYNTDKYDRHEFYFDLEDYNKIKDYHWYFDDSGYVCYRDKYNSIRIHEIIMNTIGTRYCVDHIKGEKTRNDNRKTNLRIATTSQNMRNKDLQSNNTSGITGVYFSKQRNKWVAQIKIENKMINLGGFEKKEDAAKARKEAEEKYFGEWSYDNSQKI